jgi:integrase
VALPSETQMPVRPRRERGPDAWLLDFYVGGQRYRLTRHAKGRRAAEALERTERAAIEAAQPQRQRRGATVGEAFARYWQEHGRFLASSGSERGYLNRWADALGDGTPISAVTAETIAAAVAGWRLPPGKTLDRNKPPKLRKYVTDSAINHRLLCLQRVWNRAEDLWGWRLARVPWRRLKLAEPTELPDRSIPRPVVRQMLRTINARSRPIVMAARISGLRRGALLRLEVKDIDWNEGIIRAVSKGRAGGKRTPVPITRLWRWVLRRNGRVEVGRLFGVSKQLLRQDWEEARAKIGRPDLLFRDLRHSFAQALEDAGAGDVITDALHHSDPRLRRRYAKVRIERVRHQLEGLVTRRRHQIRSKPGSSVT